MSRRNILVEYDKYENTYCIKCDKCGLVFDDNWDDIYYEDGECLCESCLLEQSNRIKKKDLIEILLLKDRNKLSFEEEYNQYFVDCEKCKDEMSDYAYLLDGKYVCEDCYLKSKDTKSALELYDEYELFKEECSLSWI